MCIINVINKLLILCIGFDLSLNDLDTVLYHTYLIIWASVICNKCYLREESTLRVHLSKLYPNIFNTCQSFSLQRFKVNQAK